MQFLTGRVSMLAWASVMIVLTGSAPASEPSEATPSDSIPAGLHQAMLAAIPRDAFDEEVKLTASDAADEDKFGFSVAISADTAIVGARWNADAGLFSGSAYIFQRDQGGLENWGEVKKLTASDADYGHEFGRSVSISGDTAIVGAWLGDSDAANISGSAYIFQRDEGGPENWAEVTKLTASDANLDDRFGISVAISGDTAIVGASWDDEAGSQAGAAYIFQQDQGGADNWGEVKKFFASDPPTAALFGDTVAISGDTAIVGAHLNDDAGTDSGSAYIFHRDDGGPDNWGEVTKLTASDAAAEDQFGFSVAISADTAIVGAPLNDDAGNFSGSAYTFQRDDGGPDNWGEVKKLTASDADARDEFGSSVSISGDTAIVGAWANDDACPGNINCNSGSAYVFYPTATVDLEHFAGFQRCYTGRGGDVYEPSCEPLDFDGDGDIDLADLAAFLIAMTGPG